VHQFAGQHRAGPGRHGGHLGAAGVHLRTVPAAGPGGQLTWFLRAVADVPLSQQEIRAHFDSGFLAQVSPGQLNSFLAQVTGVPRGGASLTGVLWQDPASDPVSLVAVADFGGTQLTVSISVDGAALISGLQLTQYQPPPASWGQIDIDLAALAPDASLLAAQVSPGGVCTPVHQVGSSGAQPLASMFKLFVLAPGQRAAFLASSVDPLPFSQAQVQNLSQAWTGPRDIDTLEWFASPDDICRAFAGLQQLAAKPALAPLDPILSANDGGIGLDPAQWPTVWFKGGSEPGVLTLGYLATNSKGQTFVVIAMLANPTAALPPQAIVVLQEIVRAAFELAG
jgi:ORF 12 gene product N-terminal